MTRKQVLKYYEIFYSSFPVLEDYDVSIFKNVDGRYYFRIFSYDGFFSSPVTHYVFDFAAKVLKSSYNVVFSSEFKCIKIEL